MGKKGQPLTKGLHTTSTECPECGSTWTTVRYTGMDEDGRTIRQRICSHCGHRFGTVEVILPPEFAFRKTDTFRRRHRDKYPAFYSSDRILIGRARIIKGGKNPYCRKGLHLLLGANLRPHPDGSRRCRECDLKAKKAYRIVHRGQINRNRREKYNLLKGTA